jgi:hypothetical protein
MKKLMLFLCFLLTSISAAQADMIDGAFKALSTNWNGGYNSDETKTVEYLQCEYFANGLYSNSLKESDFTSIMNKHKSELKEINEDLIDKHFNSSFEVVSFEDKMLFVFNSPFVLKDYCNDNEVSTAVWKTFELFKKELTNL